MVSCLHLLLGVMADWSLHNIFLPSITVRSFDAESPRQGYRGLAEWGHGGGGDSEGVEGIIYSSCFSHAFGEDFQMKRGRQVEEGQGSRGSSQHQSWMVRRARGLSAVKWGARILTVMPSVYLVLALVMTVRRTLWRWLRRRAYAHRLVHLLGRSSVNVVCLQIALQGNRQAGLCLDVASNSNPLHFSYCNLRLLQVPPAVDAAFRDLWAFATDHYMGGPEGAEADWIIAREVHVNRTDPAIFMSKLSVARDDSERVFGHPWSAEMVILIL